MSTVTETGTTHVYEVFIKAPRETELSEYGVGVTKLRVLHELENAPQTLAMVTSSTPRMGGGWSWIDARKLTPITPSR
jgi:hypothetical protein